MCILHKKVTFSTNTSFEGGANTFPWKRWFLVFFSAKNWIFLVALSKVNEMNEQFFQFDIIKTIINISKADVWKRKFKPQLPLLDSYVQLKASINPAYNFADNIYLFFVSVLPSTKVSSLKYIFRHYYFSL